MGNINRKILGICIILLTTNICLLNSTNLFIESDAAEPFFTLEYKTLNSYWGLNYGQILKHSWFEILS